MCTIILIRFLDQLQARSNKLRQGTGMGGKWIGTGTPYSLMGDEEAIMDVGLGVEVVVGRVEGMGNLEDHRERASSRVDSRTGEVEVEGLEAGMVGHRPRKSLELESLFACIFWRFQDGRYHGVIHGI
jgi:hypothetical protein